MELTKNQIKITKGIAILFMVMLHLFCTKAYKGVYIPILFIGDTPLVYYLALFGDCCVAIYCFCSGYGLMISYTKNKESYDKNNLKRIFKLYINYWVIIALFVIILGFILGRTSEYPGDLKTLLLNATAISTSYNGAWWFLTTYIILVLISPIINKIVLKYSNIIIAIISLSIYFVAYVQRVKGVISFNSEVLNWCITQLALLGTSQLPFLIGAIFYNKKIYSKIYSILNKIKFKNIICMLVIVLIVIGHGFVETLFIAAFTGIIFICMFNLIDKPKWFDKAMIFMGKHSTNIWLTHMFFYMIYFRRVVFAPKFSVLIFLWLILLCIAASIVINYICNIIFKLFDKKKIMV